jgi:Asp-tRNA(Asn)/Glu-tRNA(Gln) amidotransferase C subunit
MAKTENEKNRIKDEFDEIQSGNDSFDISKHLARIEDLPDLGEIEIYDYDSDLTVATEQSMDVLESLVDLYLSDIPQLKEHPYIKNKMRADAKVYAETIFLQKMTRKNFLSQLRQVDNGDNSARMHEVVNQTIAQIRENSKFASSQKTELEKFYKTLRKDIGYEEAVDNPDIQKKAESTANNEDGDILDNRKLNDLIKNAVMNSESDKKKKN